MMPASLALIAVSACARQADATLFTRRHVLIGAGCVAASSALSIANAGLPVACDATLEPLTPPVSAARLSELRTFSKGISRQIFNFTRDSFHSLSELENRGPLAVQRGIVGYYSNGTPILSSDLLLASELMPDIERLKSDMRTEPLEDVINGKPTLESFNAQLDAFDERVRALFAERLSNVLGQIEAKLSAEFKLPPGVATQESNFYLQKGYLRTLDAAGISTLGYDEKEGPQGESLRYHFNLAHGVFLNARLPKTETRKPLGRAFLLRYLEELEPFSPGLVELIFAKFQTHAYIAQAFDQDEALREFLVENYLLDVSQSHGRAISYTEFKRFRTLSGAASNGRFEPNSDPDSISGEGSPQEQVRRDESQINSGRRAEPYWLRSALKAGRWTFKSLSAARSGRRLSVEPVCENIFAVASSQAKGPQLLLPSPGPLSGRTSESVFAPDLVPANLGNDNP